MAEPIKDTTGLPAILTQLLGQQGSSNTNGATQQLLQALTGQTSSGSTSASTTNTANLGPLLQAFAQSSQGMSPDMMRQLITSIFTEGAQAVPALTQQFANSTGSRVQGNSGLNLALGDLNRNLSTQAAQALLNYNQGQQQTAANVAGQIANNTRQTQQTGQTANTQQQQQQQSTNSNTSQQQATKQGTNPSMLGLLGAGGTALNWLDKKGVFDSLFGKNPAPAAGGGVGTISGGGSLAPNTGGNAGPLLTNGGGASSGMLTTPSASSGFIQSPAAANPYGGSSIISGGGGMGTGAASSVPSFNLPSGGITGLGGFTTPGGGIGSGLDFNFGQLPTSFNAFGTAGTDSLGSNLNFGSNPYGYSGDAGGITGAVNGAGAMGDTGGGLGGFLNGAAQSAASGLSDVGSWIGNAFSGLGDFVGGFFANGGMIGPQTAYADGGQVGSRGIGAPGDSRYGAGGGTGVPAAPGASMLYGNIFDTTRLKQAMQAGLMDRPTVMQPGTNVQVPQGTPTMPVNMGAIATLIPFLLQQGLGFADGGQIQTGGRVRNQNYMGAPQARQREAALNYEGYAPAASGVGSSQPAGASPSLGGTFAPQALATPATPAPVAAAGNTGDANAQAWAFFNNALAQEAATNAARASGGGSGGVGEGAAPGQNEADNGAAGIGPSGIAGAPPGTPNAVSAALGLTGLSVPGLAQALAAIAAIASAVNGANAPSNSNSSPANTSADALGVDPSSVAEGNGSGGIAGTTGNDAGGSDGSVGGDSGVGSGGATGGSTSGEGGDGGGNYQDGGLVRGPGTGTSDSINVKSRQPGGPDIKYSNGEYVIPKDVVDMLGVNHFDTLVRAFHSPASATV